MTHKAKAEQQREDIEQVAWELYGHRHKPGKRLNKDEIWQEAEQIVDSPSQAALFAIHRSLIRLEKQVWEPLLAWADNQALLSLLGIIGNVGLIIAVFTFIGTEKQRRDAEVLNAWQTITSAHGQAGSGGRIQALEFLNASPGANWRRKFPWFCTSRWLCTWPAEPLDGINLSVDSLDTPSESTEAASGNERKGVYLAGVELPEASLRNANFEGAFLYNSNFKGAFPQGANFKRTVLWEANFEGAQPVQSNFEGADLGIANFEGADLGGANFEGADLGGANLKEASLIVTNLKRTKLMYTNFEGANLESVLHLTDEQLTQATLCNTTLPKGSTLDPNRDCEYLGIDPETGESIPPS